MQPGEANRFSTLSKAVAAQRTRLYGLARVLRLRDSVADQTDRVGYLMVLPYILHIVVFVGYPLAFAFILIFHRWNIYTPMKWVGLGNIRLLLSDPLVWRALGNTLYFLVIHIPLQLVIALGLAQLLNQKIRGRAFFRASYFLPFVISGVVVTILWQQLYAVETGLINVLLQFIGLPKIGWLTDHRFAMPAIAIMATWKNVAFTSYFFWLDCS